MLEAGRMLLMRLDPADNPPAAVGCSGALQFCASPAKTPGKPHRKGALGYHLRARDLIPTKTYEDARAAAKRSQRETSNPAQAQLAQARSRSGYVERESPPAVCCLSQWLYVGKGGFRPGCQSATVWPL